MPEDINGLDLSSLTSDPDSVKDGDAVSEADLALLLNKVQEGGPTESEVPFDLQRSCAGGLSVCSPPATIEFKDGRKFIVKDYRAWGWTPFGVFAIGRFSDYEDETIEEYRVFNGDSVDNILIDWAVFVDKVNEEIEESASTEPEEAESGDGATKSSSD